MGIIVIVFSLSNLIDKNFTIQPKIELVVSPFIGIVAGI